MSTETIIEGASKPIPDAALAEFPDLDARLDHLDEGFDDNADTDPEPVDQEITPGLMECVAGVGLDGLPVLKEMIERGEEAIYRHEHAADDDYEPEPDETILPFESPTVAESDADDFFEDGSEDLEKEEDSADDFFSEEEDADAEDEARIQAMLTPDVIEKMLANMRANGTIV